MTDVNVTLSVERKLEAAVAASGYADRSEGAKMAYQLGYAESMLIQILHKVYFRFGEEAMLKMMDDVNINPVHRG